MLMLFIHIILTKETNFKSLGLFENLAFVIMSTRENIRLIARASLSTANTQMVCVLAVRM